MQIQNETQVDFGTECFHHFSHTVDVTTQEKSKHCVINLQTSLLHTGEEVGMLDRSYLYKHTVARDRHLDSLILLG